MPPTQGQYKRTQYFVAPRFQLKYIGLILLLMFLSAIMCTYVVYYTTMITMGEKLASVYPQGRLIAIVNAVNLRILLAFLLVTPFVAFIALFLSHRIAGPIFRIERFLKDASAGDISRRLTLRKKDELVNLADGINSVVESVKNGLFAEKIRVDKALESLAQLKIAVDASPVDQRAALERLSKAEEEIRGVAQDISRWKT